MTMDLTESDIQRSRMTSARTVTELVSVQCFQKRLAFPSAIPGQMEGSYALQKVITD